MPEIVNVYCLKVSVDGQLALMPFATVMKQDITEQHVVEQALTLWPGSKNRKS